MLQLGFSVLARFNAILTMENLSVKDAKSVKEISEPWFEGRISEDVYRRCVAEACFETPALQKYFK